ncbi:MAG: divalent metal cation transporter, partial [bacterium]|nr:divalent metal cation transporter [bacterium]
VLAGSALVVLWPALPLVPVMVASQALNGILLPAVLVIILRLVNDRRLMGSRVNSRGANLIAGATTVLLVLLTVILLVKSF